MSAGRVDINIAPLLRQGGIIDRDLQRRAEKVTDKARQVVVKKSGVLQGSIQTERRPGLAWAVIATVPYASWIHQGVRNDPRFGTVYVKVGPRPFLVDSLSAAL